MVDWADTEAERIVTEYEEGCLGNIAFLDAIAIALRRAAARARRTENAKCRELIGARVDAAEAVDVEHEGNAT